VDKKKLAKKIRNKLDKEWREKVKYKDRGLCAICLATKFNNCHHIIPKEIKEFRHDEMNGILLCPLHHKFGTYSAHKNAIWFINWLIEHRYSQYIYLSKSIQKT
jgi:hypothetical protein